MKRETKEQIVAIGGSVLLVYVLCGLFVGFGLATIGTLVGLGFVGLCWLWVILVERLFNNNKE